MKEYGVVLENVSLKNYNSYKIGGNARYIVFPNNVDNLVNLMEYIKQEGYKYFILGNGTNVIIPDDDFDGVVINLEHLKDIVIKDDVVEVEAGCKLNVLVQELLNEEYVNLAFLSGIPGTVGGAVIQNAGCYGFAIFDFVKWVKILDDEGVKVLNKDEIDYDYRWTEFRTKKVIVLACALEITKGDVKDAREIIKENMTKRIATQPLEYPNAGSVFKNGDGYAAGKLIEDAGLKGYRIGGAMVSEKHANFIINYEMASSSDIINLIKYVGMSVKEKFGVELELEQEIIEMVDAYGKEGKEKVKY